MKRTKQNVHLSCASVQWVLDTENSEGAEKTNLAKN